MAFPDPITITVNGSAKTLARIETKGTSSIYRTQDGLFTLSISHQITAKGRIRTLVRFDEKKLVDVDDNLFDTMSEQRIIDRPEVGWSATDILNHITGLEAWTDSTVVGKLIGMES